jgi:hypothetical protein
MGLFRAVVGQLFGCMWLLLAMLRSKETELMVFVGYIKCMCTAFLQ